MNTIATPEAVKAATPDANAAIDARRQAAMPRGVGIGFPQIYADKALNAELWDVQGRRYIDFGSGIAVLNTGHRHPAIVKAVEAQLGRFTHTAFQVVPYESTIRLAERINQLAPGSHAKRTAFFTTGAEAVENAIKIARTATKRPGVIALTGGFHGRTHMGLALTGKVLPYKAGFGPFPASIYHVPMPLELHGVKVADTLAAIERLFKADIEPTQVAAIIMEPVQGEGGFYPVPAELWQAVRRICDEHGIVLIADEIQTGFARTGKMFAMEHTGVVPDLMTIAKSLAGGLPLSGVVGKAELMDSVNPGGLGGTYAANALAVAAANAVLDVIESEKLIARAVTLGDKLKARLNAIKAKAPQIVDVRGPGSMVAVEFNGKDGKPDAAYTTRVQTQAREAGLMLLTCGVYGNVVRFLYPLTIEDKVFDEALDILEQSILAA